MKGCPFNSFGPCVPDKCSFFLSDEEAEKMLDLLDSDLTAAPARPDNRCVIWINLLAAQAIFAGHAAAFRFAAYKPELLEASEHPQSLLLELLSRLESKLESLEKGLQKS